MIYFDHSSTSFPKAPSVSQRVKDALDSGCFNINRGGYAGAYAVAERVFEAREKVANLFGGASGQQVVFTGGITQSINMVLKGVLKPGDHVVTTSMEHNAVIRPLAQLRQAGLEVTVVPCDYQGQLDPAQVKAAIRSNTRMVIMTHASNVCGTILPVWEVGKLCREREILFVVDSAQTAGVLPIHMEDDCIDILTFTAHKGLRSMQGLGGLVLRSGVEQYIEPLLAGGTGSYSHREEMPRELPDRLEAGTLNIPGIVALSAALDDLNDIGMDNIRLRELSLMRTLTDGLSAIKGIQIAGASGVGEKCAIAALTFGWGDPAEVAARLDGEYGIMTRCGLHCAPEAHRTLGTYPAGVVRCSLGYENTKEEVLNALSALDRIVGEMRG